jgi:hypothetical protein
MTLKKIGFGIVCLCFIFAGAGCITRSEVKDSSKAKMPDKAKIVYLKNNIHVQEQFDRNGKPVYKASYANYTDPGSGHMIIPVNTPVTVDIISRIQGRRLLITDQSSGKEIHLEYNAKNMHMPIEDYIPLITSPAELLLDGFSKTDLEGIKSGKALKGMTKNGVQTALGYPATHKTPSLEANTWYYWTDRFIRMAVNFDENGKVSSIQR